VSEYSHAELLEGVRARNAAVLTFIYRSYFPMIQAYILKNGGNDEDAKDVFQEALIIMYRYMKMNPPPAIKDFRQYLFGVCKNLWLKLLERRKPVNPLPHEYNYEIEPSPDSVEVDASLRYSIIQKYFLTLDSDSQKVLKLYMENVSYQEIAKIMGYKDENYARRKKYLAQKELMEKVKCDPNYQDYFD